MILYKALIIFTVLLDIIIYYDGLAEAHSSSNEYFAIIIDAGSTGSRALAVNFKKTPNGSFELKNELLKKVTPGLCSFADNPQKGAESIDQVISEVKSIVPVDYENRTPILLRATAGLRLLSTKESDGLINEVIQLFDGYPYFKYNNSVAVLDGVDEGIFSWFTVNFLLDRLNGKIDRTVAALDLGGGSVQITFIPTNINQIRKESPKSIIDRKIMNKNVKLYSHSYLKLGLMSARKGSVLAGYGSSKPTNPCVKVMNEETSSKSSQHRCFKAIYTLMHKTSRGHSGDSSKPNTGVSLFLFKDTIEAYVQHIYTHKPGDLLNQDIIAFSYFYDIAKNAGLINENGGKVTIQSFYDAAKLECSKTIYNEVKKFLCFDLIFISVLMEKGFGLPIETSVTLLKFIDGHEISWALGAAYDTIEKGL